MKGYNISISKQEKILKNKKIISILLAVFCVLFVVLTTAGMIYSSIYDRFVILNTDSNNVKLTLSQNVDLSDDRIENITSKIRVESQGEKGQFGELVRVSNKGVMFKYFVDEQTFYLNAIGGKLQTVSAETYATRSSYTSIYSASNLKAFRDEVNNGDDYLGIDVQLRANISLGQDSWTPIGYLKNGSYVNHKDSRPFCGTFNGNNYTISNFKITSSNNSSFGFFGLIGGDDYDMYNQSITNLKLSNVTATSSGDYAYGYGILVGVFNGYYLTITSCIVENSTLTVKDISASCNHSYGIGGLVGAYFKKNCGNFSSSFGGVSISNCSVNANITTSNLNVSYGCIGIGGLFGARFGQHNGVDEPNVSSSAISVYSSIFKGNFDCAYSYYQFVGGIVGTVNTLANGTPLRVRVYIDRCYVVADFNVSSQNGPNPIYAGSYNEGNNGYLQNYNNSTPYTNAKLTRNYFTSNNADNDFYSQYSKGSYTSNSEVHYYYDTSIYEMEWDDNGDVIPHIKRKTW